MSFADGLLLPESYFYTLSIDILIVRGKYYPRSRTFFSSSVQSGVVLSDDDFLGRENNRAYQCFVGRIKNGDVIFLCQPSSNITKSMDGINTDI